MHFLVFAHYSTLWHQTCILLCPTPLNLQIVSTNNLHCCDSLYVLSIYFYIVEWQITQYLVTTGIALNLLLAVALLHSKKNVKVIHILKQCDFGKHYYFVFCFNLGEKRKPLSYQVHREARIWKCWLLGAPTLQEFSMTFHGVCTSAGAHNRCENMIGKNKGKNKGEPTWLEQIYCFQINYQN